MKGIRDRFNLNKAFQHKSGKKKMWVDCWDTSQPRSDPALWHHTGGREGPAQSITAPYGSKPVPRSVPWMPGLTNSHRTQTKPRLSYGHLDRDVHPGSPPRTRQENAPSGHDDRA